jgi:hypothetical protein
MTSLALAGKKLLVTVNAVRGCPTGFGEVFCTLESGSTFYEGECNFSTSVLL